MIENWHAVSSAEAISRMESQPSGLTTAEAHARQSKYGPNSLEEKAGKSALKIFLVQFASPLIYVLMAAAVVSVLARHPIDAATIIAILLINAVIGFVQEIKAQTAMAALHELAAPKSRIRRDGRLMDIPARELVPGDIIVIEDGDRIPADARLIEIGSLRVNESALTGESLPVEKSLGALAADTVLADRKNMVFQSSAVTQGKGVAVVVATGMNTELGSIASSLSAIAEEKTPLQKSISKLSNYLVVILLFISVLILVTGLLRGLAPLDMFLFAAAAAVSAIPEGLPAVVTVVLAVGMRLMAQRNVIIRRLVTVETLGSATVICSDKTGTLTLNQMTLRSLYFDGKLVDVTGEGYRPDGKFHRNGQEIPATDDETLKLALRIGALANNATVTMGEDCCSLFGDPTEGALLVAAAKADIFKNDLEKTFRRLDEIPFTSERQHMATLNDSGTSHIVHVKGAAEKLLEMSSHYWHNEQALPLDDAARAEYRKQIESMAAAAMRVLALGYVEVPPSELKLKPEHFEGRLVLVGLAGISDPPRPEAKEAVAKAAGAGIRVVMVTGDHAVTASAIAREIGLPQGKTITGKEIAAMSDAELAAQVKEISVYARIEPLQKLRIVRAWKSRGEVVAVTGDGVNDAPALKAADIGVAMGRGGTDVAREAADMVLTDDNFASVIAAVEEGRGIFNRLRGVIYYLLATNIGELFVLSSAIAILGQAPLLAVQILWVNIVTDATITIPLALEPRRGDELKTPPRSPDVGLIYPGLIWRVAYTALFMGVAIFAIFYWAEGHMSIEAARTLAFISMVSFELFKGLNARSDEQTVFKIGFFSNKWLLIALGIAVGLQAAAIYLPFMQSAFHTTTPTFPQLLIGIGSGFVFFIIEELRKLFLPKLFSRGKWRKE